MPHPTRPRGQSPTYFKSPSAAHFATSVKSVCWHHPEYGLYGSFGSLPPSAASSLFNFRRAIATTGAASIHLVAAAAISSCIISPAPVKVILVPQPFYGVGGAVSRPPSPTRETMSASKCGRHHDRGGGGLPLRPLPFPTRNRHYHPPGTFPTPNPVDPGFGFKLLDFG